MGIERAYGPDHFRKRAEEMRTKADNCEHLATRNTLLRAALAFDELARSAERISTVRKLNPPFQEAGET